MAKCFLVFTLVLVIFASVITFAVIYNAARISLSERGRELASLRIMGFTREEVAVVLLGEQAVMTMLALPVGCGLGWLFSRLLEQALATEMLRIAMPVSMPPYILSCLIVALAAVGLQPVGTASTRPPRCDGGGQNQGIMPVTPEPRQLWRRVVWWGWFSRRCRTLVARVATCPD
jgi:ABC-type antimicrobial peptide transport system permease subunit